MSHRDACHWCARRHSCYERRGQCTDYVDRRKIRKEVLSEDTGKDAVRRRLPDSELREDGEDNRSSTDNSEEMAPGTVLSGADTVRQYLQNQGADE